LEWIADESDSTDNRGLTEIILAPIAAASFCGGKRSKRYSV